MEPLRLGVSWYPEMWPEKQCEADAYEQWRHVAKGAIRRWPGEMAPLQRAECERVLAPAIRAMGYEITGRQ